MIVKADAGARQAVMARQAQALGLAPKIALLVGEDEYDVEGPDFVALAGDKALRGFASAPAGSDAPVVATATGSSHLEQVAAIDINVFVVALVHDISLCKFNKPYKPEN